MITERAIINSVGKRPGIRRTSIAMPHSKITNTSCARYPKGSVTQIMINTAASTPMAMYSALRRGQPMVFQRRVLLITCGLIAVGNRTKALDSRFQGCCTILSKACSSERTYLPGERRPRFCSAGRTSSSHRLWIA